MDTKLIQKARKLFQKKKLEFLALENWAKLWSETVVGENLQSQDQETLAFLRTILPALEEDKNWLDEHIPWTINWPSFSIQGNLRLVGEKNYDDDVLKFLESELLGFEDAKIHRRFLRAAREKFAISSNIALPSTLKKLSNDYPLTQKALDYLGEWEKTPFTKEIVENKKIKPKKKSPKWPWRPILLGFLLAGIIITIIYLILANQFKPAQENPTQSPQSQIPAEQELVLPEIQTPPNSQNLSNQTGTTNMEIIEVPEGPAVPLVPGTPQDPTYKVKQGDVLWMIARDKLFDAQAWPGIVQKNSGLIKNPDFLLPGWELALPTIRQ